MKLYVIVHTKWYEVFENDKNGRKIYEGPEFCEKLVKALGYEVEMEYAMLEAKMRGMSK